LKEVKGMAEEILVVVEHLKGKITDITFELLVLGRRLATKTGKPLKAVLLGKGVGGLAKELGFADAVITMEHELLENVNVETWTSGLSKVMDETKPGLLIMGSTNAFMGLPSYLSDKKNLPFINLCQSLDAEDNDIKCKVLLYGGKIEGNIKPRAKPVIVAIRPGNYPGDEAKVQKEVAVEAVAPPDDIHEVKAKFKSYIEPETTDIDLTQCDALISVGRGIQSQDNINVAEDLAKLLRNAAVSASRPVIDQGWLPMTRQVGKSGVTVKPKLYIALGISGAPEHIEGMKGADVIVAVNTDPKAPIFNFATYGIEGDIFEILPPLIEGLKK
jgi:electron transfer flavoprotein alpha subunit